MKFSRIGRARSDLVNQKGELLLSPGECWDRLVILELKVLNIKGAEKQEIAACEWCKVTELIQNIHSAGFIPKYDNIETWRHLIYLVDKLRQQNDIQWDCEDKVRTEESWEAAKAARDSNTKRVAIKNDINTLYGYAQDVKDYAGEVDDDAVD